MKKNNKIKKSLRFSFFDGIFASCMMGMTTDYITPYALALGASARQIGALSAIPNLFSSLMQLKSPGLTERFKSRKKMIIIFILLHTLMGLPILLVPYLFKWNPVMFLIIFVSLFNGFGAFAGPAWMSLMSEYIPFRMRGRYFGWRNRIMLSVIVVSAFFAGLILHWSKSNILVGFLIIFGIAFVSRFISWVFLTRMHDVRLRVNKESYFSFFDFIKRSRESNFAKFVIYVAILSFCVNISAPFVSVFMIRDLKFSYITYTILMIAVTLTQIFTINRWGAHADKIGNIKIIKFTSLIIVILPFLWLVSRHPAYLIFVQIIGGFAWSGFNLCAVNFIYDAVTPQKRTRCIAYFNVFVGVAICLGAFLGGYLVNLLPPLFGYNILSLFLLSSILRFFIVFFISGKIKEVRVTKKISSADLFYSVLGLRPIIGITQESSQIIREEA